MSTSFEVEKVYYDRRMKQLGEILTTQRFIGFFIQGGLLYGTDWSDHYELRTASNLDIAIVQELGRLTKELVDKQHKSESLIETALAKLTDEEKKELGL